MSDTRLEPTVRVSTTTPAAIETELLVVPVFETDDLSDVAGLDQASGGEIERARAAGEFRGKVGDVFVTPLTEGKWHAGRVALVGVGAPVDDVGSRMRRAAATVSSHGGVISLTSHSWFGSNGIDDWSKSGVPPSLDANPPGESPRHF